MKTRSAPCAAGGSREPDRDSTGGLLVPGKDSRGTLQGPTASFDNHKKKAGVRSDPRLKDDSPERISVSSC
jgi:hypothetical protein